MHPAQHLRHNRRQCDMAQRYRLTGFRRLIFSSGNTLAHRKSTNARTFGEGCLLAGQSTWNAPLRRTCSANTGSRRPSASRSRIAKSGKQAIPSPCTAKHTRVSMLLQIIEVGSTSSPLLRRVCSGQASSFPELG